MSYHYKYPMVEEYETIEEYEDAVKMWEWAEDEYAEDYMERVMDERYN